MESQSEYQSRLASDLGHQNKTEVHKPQQGGRMLQFPNKRLFYNGINGYPKMDNQLSNKRSNGYLVSSFCPYCGEVIYQYRMLMPNSPSRVARLTFDCHSCSSIRQQDREDHHDHEHDHEHDPSLVDL